ncbi:MAG: GPW/gp25 family protein [Aeromonas sp.]
MSWTGMSASDGRAISGTDHIIQSVRDILMTPVGSRVMRRDYGSELFYLIDQPLNLTTRLRMMAATVQALITWEPRIAITTVDVQSGDTPGALVIMLTWQRKDGGAQGSSAERASITIPTGVAK